MYFPLIFIQLSLVSCNLNISDTTYKMRMVLDQYKSNLNTRHSRCVESGKVDSFVKKSLSFFDKTQRYGEFLKYSNVSECVDSNKSASYVNEHVLNGLLVHEEVPDYHWEEYKTVHKKQYPSAYHQMAAQKTWRQNLKLVAEHNKRYLAGELSYSLQLNLLGDMHFLKAPAGYLAELEVSKHSKQSYIALQPEHNSACTLLFGGRIYDKAVSVTDYFNKILKLFRTVPLFDPAEDQRKTAFRRSLKNSVPTHFDWRLLGFKPRREEQLQCGACYAFAVTHALQAQLYKARGVWGELSPQQIVDCSYPDGNRGCSGGSLRGALRYAARAGLSDEVHYPYVGKRGYCKSRNLQLTARPRRWATIPAGDEDAMEKALSSIGPLAVAVNAAPFTFQLYRSGIYDDPFCTPWQLNHAMLLVGYTRQYWILLNWWGRNWGEDGYMRIRRGFNRCGVANMATYVEL